MISLSRFKISITAVLLSLLVLWAPLPFGSVTRWAETLLYVVTLLVFAFAVTARGAVEALRRVRVPALALCAVGLLAVLQAAAWPRALVGIVSPEHARIHDQAAALISAAPPSGWVSLSLAPGPTRSAALDWLVFAAAFAAAATLRSRRDRRLLAGAIGVGAAVQLVYGVQRWLGSVSSIWGVEVPGQTGRLRGTFVNPNHLAFYLEIALVLAFALCWWTWRRMGRGVRLERVLPFGLGTGLLWLTLFAVLAFTGSRAGLLAAASAALAQGVLIGLRRGRWRASLAGVGAVVAGLAVVALIGYQQGLGRLLGTSVFEITWGQRTRALGLMAGLWPRFPWLGSGIGSFREAFSLVHPPDFTSEVWMHAHSQPLELLITGGLVAVVPVAVAAVVLGRLLWRSLVEAPRTETKAAALAGLGVLVSAAVHETFDFALAMPANAITLAVVLGAAAGTRPGEGLPPRPGRPRPAGSRDPRGAPFPAGGARD